MISVPLIFLALNFSNLIPDIDVQKIINSRAGSSAMEIATDSSFANKTLKFNQNQTIYVRVTADNDGQDKHVLNLRDNNYNLIISYSMTKSGNQYLVNFPAPGTSGIYSLEANIVSSGSVSNFVQTIEVEGNGGNQGNNSNVNVKINNQVNTGNQVNIGPSTNSSTSEESEPTSEVNQGEEEQKAADQNFFSSFWQEIIKFFKGLF